MPCAWMSAMLESGSNGFVRNVYMWKFKLSRFVDGGRKDLE